jgi:hypothetical protein
MRIFRHLSLLTAACLALLALAAACRGQLPPTEPPRIEQDLPGTTTNDAPTVGPMASDVTGSGGTNALPGPSAPPAPGGSGGSFTTP